MSSGDSAVGDGLLRRVFSEFLEMPGLRLTRKQAQRLWGLDEATCGHLLEYLVDAKFLCRVGNGMYMRLPDGFSAPERLRIIKAAACDHEARLGQAV